MWRAGIMGKVKIKTVDDSIEFSSEENLFWEYN